MMPAGTFTVLTRPSPGWMLAMWTSSKQVMWLFKGSEVILMVASQMPVKTRDLNEQKEKFCHQMSEVFIIHLVMITSKSASNSFSVSYSFFKTFSIHLFQRDRRSDFNSTGLMH